MSRGSTRVPPNKAKEAGSGPSASGVSQRSKATRSVSQLRPVPLCPLFDRPEAKVELLFRDPPRVPTSSRAPQRAAWVKGKERHGGIRHFGTIPLGSGSGLGRQPICAKALQHSLHHRRANRVAEQHDPIAARSRGKLEFFWKAHSLLEFFQLEHAQHRGVAVPCDEPKSIERRKRPKYDWASELRCRERLDAVRSTLHPPRQPPYNPLQFRLALRRALHHKPLAHIEVQFHGLEAVLPVGLEGEDLGT